MERRREREKKIVIQTPWLDDNYRNAVAMQEVMGGRRLGAPGRRREGGKVERWGEGGREGTGKSEVGLEESGRVEGGKGWKKTGIRKVGEGGKGVEIERKGQSDGRKRDRKEREGEETGEKEKRRERREREE